MALAPCPFCDSGSAWNNCGCEGAIYAQRFGFAEAKKKFEAAGKRPVPSVRDQSSKRSTVSGASSLGQQRDTTGVTVVGDESGTLADGVSLLATAHPKGPGLKRGRPTREVAARRAAAVEEVEIEIAEPGDQKPLPFVARGGQFIAPPGECAYCDRRRVQKADKMRDRRHPKAEVAE